MDFHAAIMSVVLTSGFTSLCQTEGLLGVSVVSLKSCFLLVPLMPPRGLISATSHQPLPSNSENRGKKPGGFKKSADRAL